MNPIEEIKTRLRKFPRVEYESDSSSISVLPTSDAGFTVMLEVGDGVYTVYYNGWHEDFEDAAEAFNCFSFGLSAECRMKEYRRGKFAYRWTIESKEGDGWVVDSTTALVIFPFWKRKEVVYLQNDLIKLEHNNERP